jgi:1,4-dihydroxy-2-naphthoate octaprenyltransferase
MKLASLPSLLRANQWFYYKIPPVLGISYAHILLKDQRSPVENIVFCLSLVVSLTSCAAFGYLLNDSFDIMQDQLAGKKNKIVSVPVRTRLLLVLLTILLGFLPFFAKIMPAKAAFVLLVDYLVATIYSAPPFRLKENAFLSVLADGTAAHFLPVLFAFALFSAFDSSIFPAALLWAFFTGLRAIIVHQLCDEENDVRAGVVTFVRHVGSTQAQWLIRAVLFPLEVISFCWLLALLIQSYPVLILLALLYVTQVLLKSALRSRPVDPAHRGTVVIPFDFYESWCPPFFAMLLVFESPEFLFLFILHMGLFYKEIKGRIFDELRLIKHISKVHLFR